MYLIVSIVLFVLACTILTASFYMYRLGCVRKTKIASVWDDDELYYKYARKYDECGKDIVAKRLALREAGRGKSAVSLEITSHDSLHLTAKLIPQSEAYEKPRGIVAMFHGFRSEPTYDFGTFANDIRDLGFMLLMVDQRAHGGSEGKHITYGVNERFDALAWCKLLKEKYPEEKVILYGVSMGASTVMMASALELPDNVIGVVADCGFTTPAAICRKVLTKDLKVPAFPIFQVSSLLVRLFAGFDFNGASATEALTKSDLPVLMFHGQDDKFVPHEMSVENHAACADRCTFVSVEKAGHGEAYLYDKEGYMNAFRTFAESVGV